MYRPTRTKQVVKEMTVDHKCTNITNFRKMESRWWEWNLTQQNEQGCTPNDHGVDTNKEQTRSHPRRLGKAQY